MAKNTKNPLSEVEIVRRRDGVVDTTEPLDAPARRALADARLRALALTLNANEVGKAGDYPDDAELLAYLLDTLPDQRRHEVELAVRGNARAVGRLVALRTAFNTHTDKRDRRRAEHPARDVPRYAARELEIRRIGDKLQFRELRPLRGSHLAGELNAGMSALMLSHRTANRLIPPPVGGKDWVAGSLPPKQSPPRMRLGPKIGLMLRSLLKRTGEPLRIGGDLVEEALNLVDQWEKLNLDSDRGPAEMNPLDEGRSSELRRVSEHLAAVLLQLQRESSQLAEDIRQMAFTSVQRGPQSDFSFLADRTENLSHYVELSRPPLEFWSAFDSDEVPGGDLDDWSDAAPVQVGAWSLLLTGTVSPSPTLVVTLQTAGSEIASEVPILTLVRPNEAFETANVDSIGLNRVNLPTGRSVLLVQGEKEIWQVPLTLREG